MIKSSILASPHRLVPGQSPSHLSSTMPVTSLQVPSLDRTVVDCPEDLVFLWKVWIPLLQKDGWKWTPAASKMTMIYEISSITFNKYNFTSLSSSASESDPAISLARDFSSREAVPVNICARVITERCNRYLVRPRD